MTCLEGHSGGSLCDSIERVSRHVSRETAPHTSHGLMTCAPNDVYCRGRGVVPWRPYTSP